MDAADKCRLCLDANPLDIFAESFKGGEELRKYIHLASGVNIQKTDNVSKKVCFRCCQIALKLIKYRNYASINDSLLKSGAAVTNAENEGIASAQDGLLTLPKPAIQEKPREAAPKTSPKRYKAISKSNHFSVNKILEKYPNINLPPHVLTYHLRPEIWLERINEKFDPYLLDYYKRKSSAPKPNAQKTLPNNNVRTQLSDLISSLQSRLVSDDGAKTNGNVEPVESQENIATDDNNKENPQSKSSHHEKKKTDGQARSGKSKSRSDVDDDDAYLSSQEVIPKKKKRVFRNAISNAPQRAELTAQNMGQKDTFTSSLELAPAKTSSAPDETPSKKSLLSPTGRADSLFICNLCHTVWNSKGELRNHQVVHLKCKFCSKKFKTVNTLNKHVRKKHWSSSEENPSTSQPTKVDSNQGVVGPAAEAFKEPPPKEANVVNSEPAVAEAVPPLAPLPTETFSETCADVVKEELNVLRTGPTVVDIDEDIKLIQEPIITVCVSDDEDDPPPLPDNAKSQAPEPTTSGNVNAQHTEQTIQPEVSNGQPQNATDNNIVMESVSVVRPVINSVSSQKLPNLLNRNKVVKELFEKHKQNHLRDAVVQASVTDDSNISYDSNTKVVVFENLCSELPYNRIPIEFKNGTVITANYSTPIPPPPKCNRLNWSKLTPKQLVQPVRAELPSFNNGAPANNTNNVNIVSNLLLPAALRPPPPVYNPNPSQSNVRQMSSNNLVSKVSDPYGRVMPTPQYRQATASTSTLPVTYSPAPNALNVPTYSAQNNSITNSYSAVNIVEPRPGYVSMAPTVTYRYINTYGTKRHSTPATTQTANTTSTNIRGNGYDTTRRNSAAASQTVYTISTNVSGNGYDTTRRKTAAATQTAHTTSANVSGNGYDTTRRNTATATQTAHAASANASGNGYDPTRRNTAAATQTAYTTSANVSGTIAATNVNAGGGAMSQSEWVDYDHQAKAVQWFENNNVPVYGNNGGIGGAGGGGSGVGGLRVKSLSELTGSK